METTGIAHHCPLLRLPSDKLRSGNLGGGSRVSARTRRCFGRSTCSFSDSGHQQYYVSSGSNIKMREKEKCSEIKSVKKKLKLIKRLSPDLSSFKEEFGNNSVDGEKISNAVELLQAQLQQLKLEQKDLKRKMKEEKARNKTAFRQSAMFKSDSSSSSSSSDSDSDRGEVIDMRRLGRDDFRESMYSQTKQVLELPTLMEPSSSSIEPSERESCSGNSLGCSDDPSTCSSVSVTDSRATKRIEVCMGGKCRKSGAEDLLDEFQRKVGIEGAVTGCKCLGKCKNAPNLRVSSSSSQVQATRPQGLDQSLIKSICIGVSLGDVDAILADMLDKDPNENFLVAST